MNSSLISIDNRTYVWTNLSSSNWFSSSNWSTGTIPNASSVKVFITGSDNTSISFDSIPLTIQSISNQYNSFTTHIITGSNLYFESSVPNDTSSIFITSSGNIKINVDSIELRKPLFINQSSESINSSISGSISGQNSITKLGRGTFYLFCPTGSVNTYTNGTNVIEGTLSIGSSSFENPFSFGSGPVNVIGGTLKFFPQSTLNSYFILNPIFLDNGIIIGEDGIQHLATGSTFTIGSNGGTVCSTFRDKDVYIDGIITGSGDLTISHGPKQGQRSTVRITNPNNNFYGNVNITSSNTVVSLSLDTVSGLQNSIINILGPLQNGLLLGVTEGTHIVSGISGSGTIKPQTSIGSYILNVNNSSSCVFNGDITDNIGILSLIKSGTSDLILSGSNTYTGTTTINSGSIIYGINNALPTRSIVTLANSFGTELNMGSYTGNISVLQGGGLIGGNLDLNSNGSLIIGSSSNFTYDGNVIGSGSIFKTGSSNLTLDGINYSTSSFFIDSGSIICGSSMSFNEKTNIIQNSLNPNIINLNGFNQTIKSISGGSALSVINIGDSTLNIITDPNFTNSPYSGIISQSNSGTTIVSGSGTLWLNGNNIMSGSIIITSGSTLRVGGSSSFGIATCSFQNGSNFHGGSSTLTMTPFGMYVFTGSVNLIKTGGNTLTLAGSGFFTTDITLNTTLVGSTFLFSNSFTSATLNDITKIGPGTLQFSGPNGSYGDFYVLEGRFNAGSSGTIASGRKLYLGDITGSNDVLASLANGFSRNIIVRAGGSGSVYIGGQTANVTISSPMIISRSIVLWQNANNMTYTGGVIGSGDIIMANNASNPITVSTVALNSVGRVITSGSASRLNFFTISTGLGSNITEVTHSATNILLMNGTNLNSGKVLVSNGIYGGTGTNKGVTTLLSGSILQAGTGVNIGGLDSNAGTFNHSGGLTLLSQSISRHGVNGTTVSKNLVTGSLIFNNNFLDFATASLGSGTYIVYSYTGSLSGNVLVRALPGGRTSGSVSYTGTTSGNVSVTFT